MNKRKNSCDTRVEQEMKTRVGAIRRLQTQIQDADDDLGCIGEYGIGFDYVAPGTFDDQPEGYFRYQLSWGGPSDEFRFFVNPDFSAHRIEYWFLDWFDGAHRVLKGGDALLLQSVWEEFRETGVVESAYRKAVG